MGDAESQVDQLVEELRSIREKEREIKERLNAVGKPFLYAQSGLNGEQIDIKKIAPLVVAMEEDLESFDLADAKTEVPEDF